MRHKVFGAARGGFAFSLLFVFCALAAMRASVQNLSERVLIVYYHGFPESENVASFYAGQRGIPPQNFCPISPPSDWLLSASDYEKFVKEPIRQCLSAAGPENVLYTVFTYGTRILWTACVAHTQSIRTSRTYGITIRKPMLLSARLRPAVRSSQRAQRPPKWRVLSHPPPVTP